MSVQKQIKEMARVIHDGEIARNKGDLDCTEFTTDVVIKVGLQRLAGAKALYNAGYRKASEVAREIFAEIHNTLLKVIGIVDEGLDRSVRNDNEEAIKMHAGALETLKCLIPIIAELKKKYTEREEKNNG